MFATLILTLFIGGARKAQDNIVDNQITSTSEIVQWNQYPQTLFQLDKKIEKDQPKLSSTAPQSQLETNRSITKYATTTAFSQYQPQLASAQIDPSNYGDRYTHDINGVRLNHQPIIVLHETTNSASSAINFFRNYHADDNVQASYHTLIALDGTVIYLVPPDKRAFGAGNSIFKGVNGVETVKTNPDLPPSVNNFAYHVSLETPPDAWGKSNIQGHSGYTEAQYDSLAWLIAQSQVPDERITTHRDVDVANGKVDPLSFDFDRFFNRLHSFRELKTFNNS
jgi:N-acetyl-anhydromuramyl-L-alanine amidase AmpD